MIWLAARNLFQGRTRWVVSVGGVTLALMLILSLDAIFVGMESQLTAYIDSTGADVFVAQSGVRNMHMAVSSIPGSVEGRVKAVDGVDVATPIRYVANYITLDGQEFIAYVIGVPVDGALGRPLTVADGTRELRPGEAIVDGVAARAAATVGATMRVLGRDYRIAGASTGLSSIFSSIAIVPFDEFPSYVAADTMAYVLVRAAPGTSASDLTARIEAAVPGVAATTRREFGRQEIKVISDMATEIVAIMNVIGLVIGLAVMALTVYTATVARRAEYGILKALGARTWTLCRSVVAQAVITVAIALALGAVFTLLVAFAAPRLGVALALALSATSLAKAGGVALVIAVLAAVLPIAQIARIDPAIVFRRRIA
jgi:putative ABC transport system permease protein